MVTTTKPETSTKNETVKETSATGNAQSGKPKKSMGQRISATLDDMAGSIIKKSKRKLLKRF